MVKHINEKEFEASVLGEDVVLVDFYATWCPPCKKLAPVLDEIASSRKYKICSVNVDENNRLAVQYGIDVVPTLVVFKNGSVVDKSVGYIEKENVMELMDRHMES